MNLKKKRKLNLRYKMLRTTRKNIKFEIKLRKQIRRTKNTYWEYSSKRLEKDLYCTKINVASNKTTIRK